jgi:hypothetical protein
LTSAIEIPDREDPGRGHLSLTATSGSPGYRRGFRAVSARDRALKACDDWTTIARQEESRLYTSTTLYIWLRRVRLQKQMD